ncbi:MAG TPA: class I SAM-dependent methyltransferase [Vicinamibacterales bacterium]|nr:class I SAM-dependent methyltransferase [Vicinamibacterales bacterium]
MPQPATSHATTAPLTPSARRAPRSGGYAERTFLGLLDRSVVGSAVRFIVRGEDVWVGTAGHEGAPAVRINDTRFFARVLSGGNLGLGESYMDGDWDMVDGDIPDLLIVLLRARLDQKVKGNAATAMKVARVQIANLFRGMHWRNAQFHYDLGDEVFESFLDPVTMMYSCGYAKTPEDPIEQLQINKLDRICRKLEIRPGDRVLDIGCGFGGMLMHAARYYGAVGVGITTSRRHCERGNQRLAEAGLGDRVQLELRDHRTVTGTFDRVVSIGMFEHLPRKEYDRFFERVAAVLPADGRGLLHVVGANAPKSVHDPFIQKYALPGTGTPKLSELAHRCEQNGLAIHDVENMVRHYTYTARAWLQRFRANKHLLNQKKYDGRFQRMFEYYLSCATAGAWASDATVYQLLFARDYAAPMALHRV